MIVFKTTDFDTSKYKSITLLKNRQYSTAVYLTCETSIGVKITDVLVDSVYDSQDDFIQFNIPVENWNKNDIIQRLEKHFDTPVGIVSTMKRKIRKTV